jgi:hypothetical protein
MLMNKNCTGFAQIVAKFGLLIGILSQNVGQSRAIFANPVQLTLWR